ncbi:hypothetical protein GBA52_019023 [Prunus armeniaca]|nr:hypothetical protein GBA52_019023 [Prunus armeniaca]
MEVLIMLVPMQVEQQLQMERLKEVFLQQVRIGVHVPQVIRKNNQFAGSQPTQGSSSQPVKASIIYEICMC